MQLPTLFLLSALLGLASAAAIAQPEELVERACHPLYGSCNKNSDCCGSLTCFTHAAGSGTCANL
ncbi:hypothetical protein ETB97_011451 [Aspergillus alliaceus]|uniref:Uncharacterized protein n=1 Tax=Petromyces alliaceus TaxID=209559 RepID=A0A5N6GCR2_PETAA|nr:uncharacterized protein BDW43DRAFT_306979 [Aspergillus alliaceus]KAB8238293.1 hypothetical protein BDW43DRAFT_306979 [Aspergillus alliaceus]KAF5866566.1 hypothetical protein ETB97_011451 [Aspergillus burnettii]